MDMHFTANYMEYCAVKDRVVGQWRADPCLMSFSNYFEEQWTESRFWRWQIFHSPCSYATTNNPCDVFNASVKQHVQRKTNETCALIRSMITLAEDIGCDVPNPSVSIAAPNDEIKKTAKWMQKSKAVVVVRTDTDSQVRVLHVLDALFDTASLDTLRREASLVVDGDSDVLTPSSLILEKSEKKLASRLYKDSVKWSTRRAHRENMPAGGWLVNVDDNSCACLMHRKFGVCSHVIVARSVLGIGVGLGDKLMMCRRARKKQRLQSGIPANNTVAEVLTYANPCANPGATNLFTSSGHWNSGSYRFELGTQSAPPRNGIDVYDASHNQSVVAMPATALPSTEGNYMETVPGIVEMSCNRTQAGVVENYTPYQMNPNANLPFDGMYWTRSDLMNNSQVSTGQDTNLATCLNYQNSSNSSSVEPLREAISFAPQVIFPQGTLNRIGRPPRMPRALQLEEPLD